MKMIAETLKHLEGCWHGNSGEIPVIPTSEEIEKLIDACDRLTPKKVEYTGNHKYCPTCGEHITYDNDFYCSCCGQALEWSEEK